MGKFLKKYFEAPGNPMVLDCVAEIQKVAKKILLDLKTAFYAPECNDGTKKQHNRLLSHGKIF